MPVRNETVQEITQLTAESSAEKRLFGFEPHEKFITHGICVYAQSNFIYSWSELFQKFTKLTKQSRLESSSIEKNRSYTSLSWDYYKRPIVIFWFRMYWCSSRQERETGIEKNQKKFSRTFLIKQWHATILYKPKFLLLIQKRECQAREKFLLFFSMVPVFKSIYSENPLKAKPIKARSHFEKTYNSET